MLDEDSIVNTKKSNNTVAFHNLLQYLKPYKIQLIGVLISLIITSSAVLTIGKLIKRFIDLGIVAGGSSAELNYSLILILITISVLAIFTSCRFILITWVGEKVVSDMRSSIFNHILSLSPSFFERNKTGELLSRLTADTTLLLSLIGSSLSVALRNMVMLIGGIFVLLNTNAKLSAMLLIIIPAIIAPLFILGKKLRVFARNSQDKIAEITGHTEQTLGGLKVVQSYGREEFEAKKFHQILTDQLAISMQRILLRGFLTALIILLAFGGIGVVLWLGAQQVIAGTISAGELTAFIYIAIVCASSLAALSEVLGDFQKAVGATERIFEFLAITSEITDPSEVTPLPDRASQLIEFKDVLFKYDPTKKRAILDHINFKIIPGKVTALVGKSGAGKTTIFMLLERFYNITTGQILLGETDINTFAVRDLRRLFTYVPQDPYVFSTTVYENILYGNINASKDEVGLAAEQAGCMEFINKMPEGFDTDLGDKGIKLSAGQRQRLAIARAILRDPKILLLDEATSSLDSENEQLIQNALSNLMKDRTTIVIAHRLATVINADNIIVLDNGHIVEQGRHSQLIKNPQGIYAKLAKIQFNMKSKI